MTPPEAMNPSEGVDPELVAQRLLAVRQRIEAVGPAHEVRVLAVTKGFGPEILFAAAAAGCTEIGENYAQELVGKREAIRQAGIAEVHFIGRLQSNKVRLLAGLVDLYESIDRASLIDEVARRDPNARILVQVDTAGAQQKGGADPADVDRLIDHARSAGLNVAGLMTVGPTEGGAERAREGFALVRSLVDRFDLSVCSMGMTGDLEVAVQEGSTQVRIGTALFGPRAPRDAR
jgi:pyridoxal phosphate enzyme (YggS family)